MTKYILTTSMLKAVTWIAFAVMIIETLLLIFGMTLGYQAHKLNKKVLKNE